MAMDPEHLDELERRGDSLLDEERYARERADDWVVSPSPVAGLLHLDVPAVIALAEGRRLANAILSEIEIIERGDEIE